MKITHRKLTPHLEPVEGSILSTLGRWLSSLSKTLVANLSQLNREGLDVDKAEEGKDGQFFLRITTKKNNKFVVRCTPTTKGGNRYDLSFLTEKGQAADGKMDVPEVDLYKVIGRWAHEHFPKDGGNIKEGYREDGQAMPGEEGEASESDNGSGLSDSTSNTED